MIEVFQHKNSKILYSRNHNSEVINIDVRGENNKIQHHKTIGGALDRFLEDVTEIVKPTVEKYYPMVKTLAELSKNPILEQYINPLERQSCSLPGWINMENLIDIEMKRMNSHFSTENVKQQEIFPIFAQILIKQKGIQKNAGLRLTKRGREIKTIT
jgi:hypothetical protein